VKNVLRGATDWTTDWTATRTTCAFDYEFQCYNN
jgi:hypothetical protein